MSLKTTPLDALHRELDARMVPFAGYEMPVQYPTGIIKEHLHTREGAGLFDVSHMGQVLIEGPESAARLEQLVPADLIGLPEGRQVYTLFTNGHGGVLDDLIVTRWGPERFFLVVNAARKEVDIAHLRAHLDGQELTVLENRALLALQGPLAREVMTALCPAAAELAFMSGCCTEIAGVEAYVSCSGYTGEDGFEISLPAVQAPGMARLLLDQAPVQPIGLGARDSLRLEAGLCLYGHELDEEINPVQAGLNWAIGRARRPGGARAGGFPGAEVIFALLQDKPARCRVGLTAQGRRPMRDGQEVLTAEGRAAGRISSACYGASVGRPIAMAYVERDQAEPGTALNVLARDQLLPVTVTAMPFIPPRYMRG